MSKEFDNTNRGALFVNDRKEEDSHPDFNGTLNVNGKDFYISAWKKATKKGNILSLSVKPKEGGIKNRRDEFDL